MERVSWQQILPFFRRKLVRDTLSLQLSRSLGALLGFLSVIVVTRALGPLEFGRWGLVLATTETWGLLNLSGISQSVQTRMAEALGGEARREEIADLLAQYLIAAFAWALISFVALSLLAPQVTQMLYEDELIGIWSAWLSLRILGNSVYQLVLMSIRNHRWMSLVSALHVLNQLLLLGVVVLALNRSASLSSMVVARVAHAWLMMWIALVIALRFRERKMPLLPRVHELVQRIPRVNLLREWRFGIMISIDKNLGTFFVKIALQWVGAVGGPLAAAPLSFALNLMERLTFLTAGLFENMSAVIPRLVGAKEYLRLWFTLRKVQLALLAGSLLVNGILFFIFPWVIPPIFGEQWRSAIPLLRGLLIYATIITVSGALGPLYRAQRQVRLAALAKAFALLSVSAFAYTLLNMQDAMHGVIYIVLLYAVSVSLTARFALAELQRRAFA